MPGICKVESTNGPHANGNGHSTFWGLKNESGSHDEDRIKAEARKLQEKGRAALLTSSSSSSGWHDFSYMPGNDAVLMILGMSTADEEWQVRCECEHAVVQVPGSYAESSVGSEVSGLSEGGGTKAYHHPILGLGGGGGGGSEYVEEKRRKRETMGYLRGK